MDNSIIKKADSLFRNFLLIKWGAPERIQCVFCKNYFLPCLIEVGHILGRSAKAVRWKVKNAAPMCRECNQIHDGSSALLELITEEELNELWQLAHDPAFRLTNDFVSQEIEKYSGYESTLY